MLFHTVNNFYMRTIFVLFLLACEYIDNMWISCCNIVLFPVILLNKFVSLRLFRSGIFASL